MATLPSISGAWQLRDRAFGKRPAIRPRGIRRERRSSLVAACEYLLDALLVVAVAPLREIRVNFSNCV